VNINTLLAVDGQSPSCVSLDKLLESKVVALGRKAQHPVVLTLRYNICCYVTILNTILL
jgi:hypothetical protein